MDSVEEQRENLIELIKKDSGCEFEKYIKENNVVLKDINKTGFDILIYAIEHNVSIDIIKFIIDQNQYTTLNYVINENNRQKVPLISAILNNNFKVADLLISHKANINQYDIIYYLFKINMLNSKNLKYILYNGFNIRNITPYLINELIETKNNNVLNDIFKYYLFNNDFILTLLKIYKNHEMLSNQQLQDILVQEKGRITINETMYEKAIAKDNFNAIKILFENDGSEQDILFYKVNKYDLLEKSVKSNDYQFVKTILKYEDFNFKSINSKKILKEANKNRNMDIMKLLIKESLKGFSTDMKIKSKLIKNSNFDNSVLNSSESQSSLTSTVTLNDSTLSGESNDDINNTNHSNSTINNNNNNNNNYNDDIGNTNNIDTDNANKDENNIYDNENSDENKNINNNNDCSDTKYNTHYHNYIINMAIKIRNFELVKYLIEDDEFKSLVDVNAEDINGECPLITAFYDGNLDIFKYLLSHGADCNIKSNGNSLLSLAIDESDNTKYIKCLLRRNVNINEKDVNDNYPLIKAIKKNNINIVILLMQYGLKKGIDMNIMDINGNTPLILSYRLDYQEIFKFLVKYLDINKKDSNGNSLLYYAILKEDVETIEYLIGSGADINFRYRSGKSALDLAISKGYRFLDVLLHNKNNIALNIPNMQGETPLISIIKSNNYNVDDKRFIIKKLIKKGANVNFVDKDGNSPLVYAIQMKSLPIIKLLIENGANINYLIKNSYITVLMKAIGLGELEIVKYLVECNANVNYKNEFGNTPLAYAISTNNDQIVKYLIDCGADVNHRNNQGQTLYNINRCYNYNTNNNSYTEIGKKINKLLGFMN